jgi:hypothetical protein
MFLYFILPLFTINENLEKNEIDRLGLEHEMTFLGEKVKWKVKITVVNQSIGDKENVSALGMFVEIFLQQTIKRCLSIFLWP